MSEEANLVEALDEEEELELLRRAEEKHLKKRRKRGPYRKSWSGPV